MHVVPTTMGDLCGSCVLSLKLETGTCPEKDIGGDAENPSFCLKVKGTLAGSEDLGESSVPRNQCVRGGPRRREKEAGRGQR